MTIEECLDYAIQRMKNKKVPRDMYICGTNLTKKQNDEMIARIKKYCVDKHQHKQIDMITTMEDMFLKVVFCDPLFGDEPRCLAFKWDATVQGAEKNLDDLNLGVVGTDQKLLYGR